MIQPDKLLHFLAGFFIAVWFPLGWMLPITTVVGAAKEFYDYKTCGNFNIVDLVYTFAGGCAAVFYCLVM